MCTRTAGVVPCSRVEEEEKWDDEQLPIGCGPTALLLDCLDETELVLGHNVDLEER